MSKYTSWDESFKISKNKSFEIQIAYFDWRNIFSVELCVACSGYDHVGPSFTMTVLGLFLNIALYDHRHWDHETNDWEIYE